MACRASSSQPLARAGPLASSKGGKTAAEVRAFAAEVQHAQYQHFQGLTTPTRATALPGHPEQGMLLVRRSVLQG